MSFPSKLAAFVARDFRIELSYRFSVLLHLFGMLAHLGTFYFIGRIFPAGAAPWLAPYGGDYFSFVLIGIAFTGFLGFGLSGFSAALRTEQLRGTLESLLATPTPAWQIAILSTVSGHFQVVAEGTLYLAAGVFLLGADLSGACWSAALAALLLSMSAFTAFGILAGSFILYFKRGDPVNWMFGTVSQFLGGVYFPVAVLPGWLAAAAVCLPVTHGLEALRGALLRGAGIVELAGPLGILFAFSLAGWPAAVFALGRALDASRRSSSLGHH